MAHLAGEGAVDYDERAVEVLARCYRCPLDEQPWRPLRALPPLPSRYPSWPAPPLLAFRPSTSIDHLGLCKLLLTQHGSPRIALLSASLPNMPDASSPSSGTSAASRRKKLAAASKAKSGASTKRGRAELAVSNYREVNEFILRTNVALSSTMQAIEGVTAAMDAVAAAQVLATQPPRIHGASTRAGQQRKGTRPAGHSFSKSSS